MTFQIPGMLNTVYACISCKKIFKKSEVSRHEAQFEGHKICKTRQEIPFEIIKEEVKPQTSEIDKLRQENKVLRQHLEEETISMELLTLKLKRIRRMYE